MDLSSAREAEPNDPPVDNSKIEKVAAAVAQTRLETQTGVRNAAAWKRACLKNLRADADWWAHLIHVCTRWDAPIDMLAEAAEGRPSSTLNHYKQRDRQAFPDLVSSGEQIHCTTLNGTSS